MKNFKLPNWRIQFHNPIANWRNQTRNPLHIGIIKVLVIVLLAAASVATVKPAAETVFATYEINNSRKLPIYSVDIPDKRVSISFDAAWGADDTDTLLAILEEHEVKTTFFLCGYWVDKYPEEVKRIHEAGHDIANHGDTHAHGAQLSKEKNKSEIIGVHEKIRNLLGIEMNLFRPPYGEYNNAVIEATEELNYYPVQWDVDSHDWMKKGVQYTIDRVLNNKNLRNGSIILFHNDAKDTPTALPFIIKGLKAKGYEIVPLSELIYKSDFYLDHTGRQKLK